MEQVNPFKGKDIYNSPIEIGIRTLILLNEFYPTHLDMTQLVLYNHIVIHTEDFGGPQSLHPQLDDRAGELAVLRSLIQDGLSLIQRFNLVSIENTPDGIFYTTTEECPAFVSLMTSSYSQKLIEKAKWVASVFSSLGKNQVEEILHSKINMWRFDA